MSHKFSNEEEQEETVWNESNHDMWRVPEAFVRGGKHDWFTFKGDLERAGFVVVRKDELKNDRP